MGNLFAPYEFYSCPRKVTGNESTEQDGINGLYTLIQGLFHPVRLLDVVKTCLFPDTAKSETKICCRYPQYYAARKLYYNNIKRAQADSRQW